MAKSSNKDDYFGELKEWSKRKLEIIEKYLDGAVRILGRRGTVYYVDGFAGPGHYGDGEVGSPVRAVALAQRLQREDKPYRLHCINVEEDKAHFANLEAATVAAADIVTNYPGEFNSIVAGILDQIGSSPTVFFLDPFGVDGIGWDELVRIVQRDGPTDIWLRFDVATVRRLDGNYDSPAPDAPAKYRLLQRAYGIHDRDELHRRLDGPDEETRNRSAVLLYMDELRRAIVAAKGDAYVGGYPIKSIDGQVKYYLIFAGAHPKAGVLASDIVYSVEHNYQRDVEDYRLKLTRQSSFLDQVDPSQEEIDAQKARELADSLWAACSGKTLSRLAARAAVWRDWFGRVSKPHATAAMKLLRAEGRVTIAGTPGDDDAVIAFAAAADAAGD